MRGVALLLLLFTMSLAALAQQRFDFKVREDMFAGMDGDTVAFDHAMKLIASELPGTAYAKNAGQRRADPSARASVTCLGCH
jgi:hypothetical protein